MNQSFLWILILLSLFLIPSLAVDFHYEACRVPRTCSNNTQQIQFPFYIQGEQQDFCGFPGFKLSCNNYGHPVIRLLDNDYVIHQIFYNNHSLIVSNAAAFYYNTNTNCVPPIQNLSIPTSNPFQLISPTNIFLFYNCNSSFLDHNLTQYKLDCPGTGDGNLSTLALFEENPDLGYAIDQCRNGIVTKAPLDTNGLKSDGLVVEALKRGFGLSWIASNCSVCEQSRGKCGFDYQAYQFRCFCTDWPHARGCDIPGKRVSWQKVVMVVAAIVALMALFIGGYCFSRRRGKKKYENAEPDIPTVESLQFDLATIQAATRNFSYDNKLGEGGFGAVYKGALPSGQDIAVKRLSSCSGQGAEEFKNEVVVVAKLQHRYLVRLLGFCLEEEKILVYEFVPNKSLDFFLYDPEKRGQLDWSRRYNIIEGIARGILYLHHDSRLRIIHRDLKPSNILLDRDMNPKISDFGMARIFGVDQTQGSTNRIVGTYGYMSPEYVMHGEFSVKSDIYSFGVIVLEIIAGKKNSSFYHVDVIENLVSYAWKLWRAKAPLELLDPILRDSYSRDEVIRCIHLGLLCVQEDPTAGPTTAKFMSMLSNYFVALPSPQRPGFFLHGRTEHKSSQSRSKSLPLSVNEASITHMQPR